MRKRTHLQIWIGLILVFALLFFLFFTDNPDIPQVELAQTQTEDTNEAPRPVFELTITEENVQAILAATQPPSYINREIIQTRFWENGSGTRRAELWTSGDAMRLSWDNSEHMLFTEEYYYFWFLNHSPIRRPNRFSNGLEQVFDEFSGIPSIRHVLNRETSEILSVAQGNLNIAGQVYFVIILSMGQSELGLRDYYYICAQTATLLQMESFQGDTLFYRFETLRFDTGPIDSTVFIVGV